MEPNFHEYFNFHFFPNSNLGCIRFYFLVFKLFGFISYLCEESYLHKFKLHFLFYVSNLTTPKCLCHIQQPCISCTLTMYFIFSLLFMCPTCLSVLFWRSCDQGKYLYSFFPINVSQFKNEFIIEIFNVVTNLILIGI